MPRTPRWTASLLLSPSGVACMRRELTCRLGVGRVRTELCLPQGDRLYQQSSVFAACFLARPGFWTLRHRRPPRLRTPQNLSAAPGRLRPGGRRTKAQPHAVASGSPDSRYLLSRTFTSSSLPVLTVVSLGETPWRFFLFGSAPLASNLFTISKSGAEFMTHLHKGVFPNES